MKVYRPRGGRIGPSVIFREFLRQMFTFWKTKDWLPKMGEKIGVFFMSFVIFCYSFVVVF